MNRGRRAGGNRRSVSAGPRSRSVVGCACGGEVRDSCVAPPGLVEERRESRRVRSADGSHGHEIVDRSGVGILDLNGLNTSAEVVVPIHTVDSDLPRAAVQDVYRE